MAIISWLIVMAALYGTWLNAKQDRQGFWWWLGSDVVMCLIFLIEGFFAQAFLFFVYALLAVKGLYVWKKKS